MKKVFVIRAKDEFELVKLLNEEQNKRDVFASQTHQKTDGSFIAFVFYSDAKSSIPPQNKSFMTSNCSDSKGGFIPSNEQIERWKKIRPTTKTINLLKKKGYSDDEINYIKTQYDAHTILENLKKENL
jgi:hypothetical protein